MRPSALERWDEIATRLEGRRPALFLDYDGTLSPIAPRPELAALPAAIREELGRVARAGAGGIVSGPGGAGAGGDRLRPRPGGRGRPRRPPRPRLRRQPRLRHRGSAACARRPGATPG